MDIAVKTKDLTKCYKIYNKPVDRLKESLNPFRRKYHRDFFALNNISFNVTTIINPIKIINPI